jgi:hypothetical protein
MAKDKPTEYAADLHHMRQWAAFTKSLGVEAPQDLGVVIEKISEFVLPPVIAAATAQPIQPPVESSKSVAANWVTCNYLTETICFQFVVRR